MIVVIYLFDEKIIVETCPLKEYEARSSLREVSGIMSRIIFDVFYKFNIAYIIMMTVPRAFDIQHINNLCKA